MRPCMLLRSLLLVPLLAAVGGCAGRPPEAVPGQPPAAPAPAEPAFEFRMETDDQAAIAVTDKGRSLDELGARIKEEGDKHKSPEGLSDLKVVIRANERRLGAYRRAAAGWAAAWTDLDREIAGLPLPEAHRVMASRPEGVLPFSPPGGADAGV
jgi:hypothetical protein